MPPRDVLLTVGNEILSAPMSFRCRYFEYLAYHELMQRYFDEDPNFKWEQAPRPRLSDESYKAGYFDEITVEERLQRTAALDFVTNEAYNQSSRYGMVKTAFPGPPDSRS